MSTPTRHIDGHTALGGNATVGGKATVRGHATFDHNVRVKGYLEAPNVRGGDKGMWRSKAALEAGYPNPEDGWHALVGDTLPADVYVAIDGQWVATGKQGGVPPVELEALEEKVEGIFDRQVQDEETIRAHGESIDSLKGSVNELRGDVDGLRRRVESIEQDDYQGQIDDATRRIGDLEQSDEFQDVKIKNLEEEIAKVKSDTTENSERLDTLVNYHNTLVEEYRSIGNRVGIIEATQSATARTVDEHTELLAGCGRKIESLREAIAGIETGGGCECEPGTSGIGRIKNREIAALFGASQIYPEPVRPPGGGDEPGDSDDEAEAITDEELDELLK